ncbi:MAG: Acyl-CoA dehydrogenase, Mycobacterial subgroup FadE16 [uncultured Acidimicrobiales bacterium]|uniref:Acyl-CoA dehydrogenase, Mycobacterial subgroup FadE16 n=1 Tax=uncultured Acidimicrobiales bacterium TaxID=310071 RepID=A0A6J4IX47_9ACTN|nr:MAG: Acyl-CoA dehydrogenase, Mycobacterial subgroup FadE16 [uncultured Acidimicrobiales bacterium]
MSTVSSALPAYLARLAPVITDVVAPAAAEIDRTGAYPRPALDALGRAGLLGLISAPEVGGSGEGHRAATAVVQAIAEHCGSTAMVLMMHYAGTAVIEASGGPADVRERIAAGDYVTTLAFSEAGSRSMFWAPMSTAVTGPTGAVRLDAEKSWVTSAGQADGYVWSSRPVVADGASTMWLVPADAPGLKVGAPFDGLGLRGNSSSPMSASGVEVPMSAMLGTDGGGFDTMLATVLPYFQVMNAGFSIGTANSATGKAALHAATTRFEHLDQTLADNPVVRANVARMRIRTDAAEAVLLDTLTALETGGAHATLRVLEVKALAGETAIDVTDLAMRVCGGAAFRKEVGVERNFRDSRAASVMAPTTDTLYDLIGRIACGLPLF